MSQQNIAIVRSGYEAFRRGDIPAVLALLDSNIEFTVPDSLPTGGTYRGHEEVLRLFQKLSENYKDLSVEVDEYIEAGDYVIARGRHKGRAAKSEFVSPFAMFWTIRNGKAVKVYEYADTARTLKAITG
jgi:ketosteroid isomerase-like protein